MTPGATIANRYVVERPLGEGGLASAYVVRDRVRGADMALKLVSSDASSREVLQREFLSLRDVAHPRLVRVHDFGCWRTREGLRAFYTSELVQGVDLRTYAEARDWTALARPIGDVLSAIGSLHRRGLLHGDVHPGNILVDAHGRAVLIDLSCTRPLALPLVTDVSGTAAYIAPELLRGEVHSSADLYALGKAIRSLGAPLPTRIDRVLERMTSARAEDRPISAEEAALALGVPWESSPATCLLGSVLVGRDAALTSARSALDALERGAPGPRVVTVTGDEGAGRTRLLEELKIHAQLRMTTVLVDGRGDLSTLFTIALGETTAIESMSAMLAALGRVEAKREPVVLLVDDADAWPAAELERVRALARSSSSAGSVLLILGSRGALRDAGELDIALGPLDERDLHAWLRSQIPEAAVREIVRATGGFPKEIAAVLGQLDGAAWDSRTLARAATQAGTSRGALVLDGLDAAALELLARIVAAKRLPRPPKGAALDDLVRRGLVVLDAGEARLLRRSDTDRAARGLGPRAMEAAHRALADAANSSALAGGPDQADLLSTRIIHLSACAPEEGARLLAASSPHSAVVLRPAADAVLASKCPLAPDVVLRCTEIYADAGEPARALSLVAAALKKRPPNEERDVLRRLAGQCYAQMGDSRRGARLLSRLLPRMAGRPAQAPIAAALSLALLKRGSDASALDVVREALALPAIEPQVRFDLLLNAAFASSRRGTLDEARRYLALARELGDGASPRGRFRLASAIGFVEYGAGETAAAVSAYKNALDLAEQHGLDDVIASAALNYGSACHELGDLARALDAYDRGHRLAVALAMPTTRATLEFDRAKVHADIGSFDRAAHHAEIARDVAARERMPLIEAGAIAVLADAASARGDEGVAQGLLDRAMHLLDGASSRDVVALELQRAQAYAYAGNVAAASASVERCAGKVRELGTKDVEAGWLGVRGALRLLEGRPSDAIVDLERAIELAQSSGQRGLIATLEARMGEAFRATGSTFLAERHTHRARESWETTLASLPAELRDAFRRHPLRRRVFASAESTGPRAYAFDTRRILEINRRLNSASSTTAVLEETMDAAISLTQAERGFLLAFAGDAREGALKVTVARNVDRETLRRGKLKFSRTVAERVVRTGEPVIAVDAAFDPRFTKALSVHAMKLKSLLCVPIRSPDGVLGAIYVDHRFTSGSFRTELVDVLLALGDQAALALSRARLVEELRRKTRELEERNAEVEQLARGQALEIARLKQSLAEDEPRPVASSPPRFDYRDIVARSQPMRRVLSVLDRVIDTDVTVLVRGESGTGKERIARAIHANSARAKGPFIAINCGALPETLLEAELFGYRRGAFSGAVRDQPGLFVSAVGGTLLLDELGEMPPSMQVKLLRVLQEREVRPLGANEAVATDVRLVCATNRDLKEEVRAGRFREDLFYRIAVVDLELPPLRDRLEDILPLSEAILARLGSDLGRPAAQLDRRAERALLAHAWSGNVRELENALTKAFLLGKSHVLAADDFDLGQATASTPRGRGQALRGKIVAALEETDWNVVLAARLLAMPRATLYRKMNRFGITRPER